MKAIFRVLAVTVAAVITVCAFGLCASAQTITGTYGTLEYELDPATFTLTLSGYGTVPYISDQSLNMYRLMLKEVVICEGVDGIADHAFDGCTNLKSVTIPDSVTEIGDNSFAGCDNMTVYCGKNSIAAYYAESMGISYVVPEEPVPYNEKADLDGNGEVNDQDAVYLLFHTFFPDEYPVPYDCDYNIDGKVDDRDAIYLLFYTFFPDDYPIYV